MQKIYEIPVGVQALYDDVIIPTYATEGSSGFDFHAYFSNKYVVGFTSRNYKFTTDASSGQIVVSPGDRMLIPTGLKFDIPPFHQILIFPRSGHSLKEGLTLSNCVGVVDEDYPEEVFVSVVNVSDEPVLIYHGDRIAQGQIMPRFVARFLNVESIEQKTDRSGGFGHSGQ